MEQVSGQEEIDQADAGYGPELVQQQMEWCAFQEYATQDDQEVSNRSQASFNQSLCPDCLQRNYKNTRSGI